VKDRMPIARIGHRPEPARYFRISCSLIPNAAVPQLAEIDDAVRYPLCVPGVVALRASDDTSPQFLQSANIIDPCRPNCFRVFFAPLVAFAFSARLEEASGLHEGQQCNEPPHR
jgi:hypothetical protein